MDTCLYAGVAASVLAEILKRVPGLANVLRRYPKIAITLIIGVYYLQTGQVTDIECWIKAIGSAIGAYEVAIKPLTKISQ